MPRKTNKQEKYARDDFGSDEGLGLDDIESMEQRDDARSFVAERQSRGVKLDGDEYFAL